ncbi:hypothetical protein [Streptomyces sp. NPDC002132]|uniref:hypothetical protein n=1 Tax=unclassified Streptomyces TaxID=2593676 RepID=UPI003316708A
MLTETTGRTAQDLASEPAALREADWASVWPGPPWGPERELREWCGRQGWEPLTSGAWGAEDFPEPPDPAFWEDRASRLRRRSPYRMAHWTTGGLSGAGAVFVLDQSVSFPTWTRDQPGGSMISLSVCPAAGERRAE